MNEACAVNSCDRDRVGRQVYCRAHYLSWRRTGNIPSRPVRPVGLSPLQRLLSKVNKTSTCWIWTGHLNPGGYGTIGISERTFFVHRWIYEALVGPIPDGLDIDHLCRVRNCVNPAHLEPVTRRTNTMRSGIAPAAINAAKRECIRGHEFTPENTYIKVGLNSRQRICRTCRAAQKKRARKSRAQFEAAS